MATESYVLNVLEVIAETDDASSVVFEVPDELAEEFTYTPGQFLTVAVPSDETGLAARCYSLSSAPHSGRHQITVKRTADGYASNWINDNLRAGDTLRVLPPSGIFTPKDFDADLLLFAGGSGITPVMSIVRTALEKGSGRVVLLYANRDERSVIFAEELGELATEYADRFTLVHWLESVQGLPTQRHLQLFASYFAEFTAFTCGPAPYMKAVTDALKELDFPRERRHVEKFVSLGGNPFGDVEEVLAVQEQLRDADDHEPEDDSARTTPPTTPRGSRARSRSRSSSTAWTTRSTTGRATRCCWSSWRRRASTPRSPAARASAAPAPASSSRAR